MYVASEVLLAHCGRQVFTVWFDHPVNKMFADFKHRHTHLAFVQRVNDDDEGRDPFYELQVAPLPLPLPSIYPYP